VIEAPVVIQKEEPKEEFLETKYEKLKDLRF